MDEEDASESLPDLENLPELIAELDRRINDREGAIDWEQLSAEQ